MGASTEYKKHLIIGIIKLGVTSDCVFFTVRYFETYIFTIIIYHYNGEKYHHYNFHSTQFFIFEKNIKISCIYILLYDYHLCKFERFFIVIYYVF